MSLTINLCLVIFIISLCEAHTSDVFGYSIIKGNAPFFLNFLACDNEKLCSRDQLYPGLDKFPNGTFFAMNPMSNTYGQRTIILLPDVPQQDILLGSETRKKLFPLVSLLDDILAYGDFHIINVPKGINSGTAKRGVDKILTRTSKKDQKQNKIHVVGRFSGQEFTENGKILETYTGNHIDDVVAKAIEIYPDLATK